MVAMMTAKDRASSFCDIDRRGGGVWGTVVDAGAAGAGGRTIGAAAGPGGRATPSALDIGDVDEELFDLVDLKTLGEIGDKEFQSGLYRLLDIKYARSVALNQQEALEKQRLLAGEGKVTPRGDHHRAHHQHQRHPQRIHRTSSWAAGTTDATKADRRARSREARAAAAATAANGSRGDFAALSSTSGGGGSGARRPPGLPPTGGGRSSRFSPARRRRSIDLRGAADDVGMGGEREGAEQRGVPGRPALRPEEQEEKKEEDEDHLFVCEGGDRTRAAAIISESHFLAAQQQQQQQQQQRQEPVLGTAAKPAAAWLGDTAAEFGRTADGPHTQQAWLGDTATEFGRTADGPHAQQGSTLIDFGDTAALGDTTAGAFFGNLKEQEPPSEGFGASADGFGDTFSTSMGSALSGSVASRNMVSAGKKGDDGGGGGEQDQLLRAEAEPELAEARRRARQTTSAGCSCSVS